MLLPEPVAAALMARAGGVRAAPGARRGATCTAVDKRAVVVFVCFYCESDTRGAVFQERILLDWKSK